VKRYANLFKTLKCDYENDESFDFFKIKIALKFVLSFL